MRIFNPTTDPGLSCQRLAQGLNFEPWCAAIMIIMTRRRRPCHDDPSPATLQVTRPRPGLRHNRARAGPGRLLRPFRSSLYYRTTGRRKIINRFSISVASADQPRDTTSFVTPPRRGRSCRMNLDPCSPPMTGTRSLPLSLPYFLLGWMTQLRAQQTGLQPQRLPFLFSGWLVAPARASPTGSRAARGGPGRLLRQESFSP